MFITRDVFLRIIFLILVMSSASAAQAEISFVDSSPCTEDCIHVPWTGGGLPNNGPVDFTLRSAREMQICSGAYPGTLIPFTHAIVSSEYAPGQCGPGGELYLLREITNSATYYSCGIHNPSPTSGTVAEAWLPGASSCASGWQTRLVDLSQVTSALMCGTGSATLPEGWYYSRNKPVQASCTTSSLPGSTGPRVTIERAFSNIYQTLMFCDVDNVPEGLIVSDIRSADQCIGKAYTFRRPSEGYIYCDISFNKIPRGWGLRPLRSYETSTNYCDIYTAYKLTHLGEQNVVCAQTWDEISQGYVIAAYTQEQCGRGGREIVVDEVTSTDTNVGACTLSGIFGVPPGAIINQIMSTPCSGGESYDRQYLVSMPNNAASLQMCYIDSITTPLPSGYTVEAITPVDQLNCDGHPRYSLRLLNNLNGASSVWMCRASLNSDFFLTGSGNSRAWQVPDGYVITERVRDYNGCPYGAVKLVRPASSGTTIMCSGHEYNSSGWSYDDSPFLKSKFPTYAIVASDTYDQCHWSAALRQGYQIKNLSGAQGTQAVCRDSPIPLGWSSISEITRNYPACLDDWGFVIGTGTSGICDTNSVPDGYVITGVEQNGCGTFDRYLTAQPSVSGETAACFWAGYPATVNSMPAGFVTVRKVVSSGQYACPFGWASVIKRPPTSGITSICSTGTPSLPDGFGIVPGSQEVARSSCNSEPGYDIQYGSGGGGSGGIPAEFSDAEPDVPAASVSVQCNSGGNTLIDTAQPNTSACP